MEKTTASSGPLKKEWIFTGSEGTTLFVTYREFKTSLETPSLTVPLIVKVDDTSKPIELRGIFVQVKSFTPTLFSYEIVR